MMEFRDICEQMLGRNYHRIVKVSSLPSPTFTSEGREIVSFSTNNYLGLATSPRLIAAARSALERYGVGNCESRLLGGELDIYGRLEDKLAKLKRKDSAVLFATGYLTNMGVLSTLPTCSKIARVYGYRPKKHYKYAYFNDEFNHISIREGLRMSGAAKVNFRHCDMNNLQDKLKASAAQMKIIVTDGVFSQDGDIAPLPDMITLAEKYDAMLYVDDAHATGVLGPNAGGTSDYFNVDSERMICMGTLSKAYGAIGGFIATDGHLAQLLRYVCTAYGFTSTLPPDQAAAVSEAIDMATDEPQRRQRLWENQKYFVQGMDKLGYNLISRVSCILPVLIGDDTLCEQYSQVLEANGFHVDSIIFPAVGTHRARLRFIMNANHTREQIDRLLTVMKDLKSLPAAMKTRP